MALFTDRGSEFNVYDISTSGPGIRGRPKEAKRVPPTACGCSRSVRTAGQRLARCAPYASAGHDRKMIVGARSWACLRASSSPQTFIDERSTNGDHGLAADQSGLWGIGGPTGGLSGYDPDMTLSSELSHAARWVRIGVDGAKLAGAAPVGGYGCRVAAARPAELALVDEGRQSGTGAAETDGNLRAPLRLSGGPHSVGMPCSSACLRGENHHHGGPTPKTAPTSRLGCGAVRFGRRKLPVVVPRAGEQHLLPYVDVCIRRHPTVDYAWTCRRPSSARGMASPKTTRPGLVDGDCRPVVSRFGSKTVWPSARDRRLRCTGAPTLMTIRAG